MFTKLMRFIFLAIIIVCLSGCVIAGEDFVSGQESANCENTTHSENIVDTKPEIVGSDTDVETDFEEDIITDDFVPESPAPDIEEETTSLDVTTESEHVHNYTKTIIESTCTEDGYTIYFCEECKDSYVGDKVNPLGHEYTKKTVAHTHLEKGYDEYTCTRCKNTYRDNYVNPIVYRNVNETVYAISAVNVRTGPSTSYNKVGQLSKDDSVKRIGIGEDGWSKVEYNGDIAYISSGYLTTEKPINLQYPIVYEDETCKITITREWFEHAWVYAAHIEFTDYSRLSTECAYGKYKGGYETTSHTANRVGAILAINGCYSAPKLNYTVVRGGTIWNGAERNLCLPAVYSSNNGLLLSAWEGKDGDPSVKGNVQELVDAGLVTDTFCFGPPGLINGVIKDTNTSGSRAQRTFIGTNGNPGDIWLCVSDGRYNDGESAGLLGNQCMRYLESKGCTFGVNLDGGGSSTMVFQGKILNANAKNERAVVDFVCFK